MAEMWGDVGRDAGRVYAVAYREAIRMVLVR